MKKLITFLLALTVILSFVGCKSGTDATTEPTQTPTTTKPTEPTTTKPSETTAGTEPSETPGNTEPADGVLEGSLEGILEKIYETADLSDSFKKYIGEGLQTTEITDERCEYHLGKAGIEFEEAIASVPIMMPSAYELDLVRVKEGADVEEIKKEIKENVDPRKWICVGIDPDNVIVDNIDDIIIVILSDNEGKALHEAFLALEG